MVHERSSSVDKEGSCAQHEPKESITMARDDRGAIENITNEESLDNAVQQVVKIMLS